MEIIGPIDPYTKEELDQSFLNALVNRINFLLKESQVQYHMDNKDENSFMVYDEVKTVALLTTLMNIFKANEWIVELGSDNQSLKFDLAASIEARTNYVKNNQRRR